jgi:hypothetical protein
MASADPGDLLQNPRAGCGASTSGLKSLFVGYRFHDLRHQAAEFKASDQTILSIAGHVVKRTTPPVRLEYARCY